MTTSANCPRMLWIPGWSMAPDVWRGVAGLFPEAEHAFVDFSSCRSPQDFGDCVAQALNARTGSWTLVGWSMGAMLALQVMLERQFPADGAKLASVVAVAGTLQFCHDDRRKGWPPRIVSRMLAKLADDPANVVLGFRKSIFSPSELESGGAWLRELVRSPIGFSAEGLAAGLQYLLQTDLRDQWEKLARSNAAAVRVLWLHGQADPICPYGAIPQAGMLPGVRTVLVPGCGHAPFAANTEAFIAELRRHLHDIRQAVRPAENDA